MTPTFRDRGRLAAGATWPYLFAGAAVGVSFAVRVALARAVGPGLPPYLLFYPAVMLTSVVTGRVGPGLLATALACLLSAYQILPTETPEPGAREAIGLGIFGSMGAVMSLVAARYDQARRRLAEQAQALAVHARDARYRGVVENIRDSVLVLEAVRDRGGRVVDWLCREANEAARRLVGGADQQGKRASEVRPEGMALRHEQWCRVLESGVASSYEIREGAVELLVRVFRLDENSIGIAALDITDRKHAELALRESEGRLRLAQDVANAGSWEWDVGTGANLWSDGAWRLFGLEIGSLVPSYEALVGAILPEDRPAADRAMRLAASQGSDLVAEWRVRGRAGDTRWIMVRGRPLRNDRGLLARYAGIVLDISDRKRAEEASRAIEREGALRESESRFRGLIENSTDLIMVLDVDSAVRFWSPGATAALGWTQEEILGRKLTELASPEDARPMSEALSDLAGEPGRTAHLTTRFRRSDGAWRTVESAVRNLLTDPVLKGVVVNGRDVTEQRRLLEQFQETQKLESIGRLAGGVAHDFNNLLTAILGSTEALRERADLGGADSREDVETILAASERARQLTRQLLAFARKQPISLQPMDLNAAVVEGQKLLRHLLPESIAVTVALQPGGCPVLADAGQLQQVIMNLAANSGDAMSSGGRLSIETAVVDVDERAASALGPSAVPGRYGRLTVRDSGPGLADDVKAHMFEPFFTTKPRGRGTGLGLATVYGIVAQSNGFIDVESAPETGTVFHAYLPRTARAVEESRAPSAPRLGGTERVLVVEDDPLVREVTGRALRRAGYDVLVASSAVEALEVTATGLERLDLLVTDVVMPDLDGRGLARELQARRPQLRVLFVSGYSGDLPGSPADVGLVEKLLRKPFTVAGLLAAVRAVLDGAGPRATGEAGARGLGEPGTAAAPADQPRPVD